MDSGAEYAPSFSEKSFADFHLYTLSDPVTLNESSSKQVEFIPKVYGVNIRKYYLVTISAGGYSEGNIKAQNKVEFNNSEEFGLGIPLPKGTVRVFKEDEDDNSLEFVGEDSIDHTPKNENITLNTGNAFDITVKKYSESKQSYSQGGYKAKMNLTITNHKDTEAEVEVRLSSYYGDNLKLSWESNGVELIKETANKYKWVKTFQPDEEFAFEWREDYRR